MRECLDCTLIFANPMPSYDPIQFFEDQYSKPNSRAMAGYYDRLKFQQIRQEASANPPYCSTRSELLKLLGQYIAPPARVLDIGCGVGYFLEELTRGGYTAIGVEPSATIVASLKERGFEAYVGDLKTLPDVRCIDAVTMCFALHHIPPEKGMFSHIRERFPNSVLAIMDGYYQKPPYGGYEPPRYIGWWGHASLLTALKMSGYRASCVAMEPKAADYPFPRTAGATNWATHLPDWAKSIVVKGFFALKPCILWLPMLILKSRQQPLVVIGIGR